MKKLLCIAIAVAIAILALLAIWPKEANTALAPVAPEALAKEVTPEPTLKEKLLADIPGRESLVKQTVSRYAKQYGVSEYQMLVTLHCENGSYDPNKQSGMRYKKDNPRWGTVAGEQERSFGLAMIHLPDHPNITKEQATDPEFAIQFMASEFKKGNQGKWSCWKSNFAAK